MDKLSAVTTFQKTIDTLKNTECNQKEKLHLFGAIAESIMSSPLRAHANYLQHLSGAVTLLLMFCEEMDSVVRMNAEEQLYKIVRFSEHTNIVRIQFDLYHEIKKNGNVRSLRISLQLLGHYMPAIKQSKTKPYATNLLPCIYAISKRRETLLLETLSEFVKAFGKYLQICLNENEVVKLMEVFIGDTTAECTVKRRCAAHNVICIIENSRRHEIIGRHALNKALEILTKEYAANAIIGVLGFLRLLLPVLLQQDNCDFAKIIEIYDLCLQLLHDKSHSTINAALEVICIILNEPRPKLKALLTTVEHVDIIRKRKSLKSVLFNRNINESKTTSRKSSAETIKNVSGNGGGNAKEKTPVPNDGVPILAAMQSKTVAIPPHQPAEDTTNVNKIDFGTMERKENYLRVKQGGCQDATVAGLAPPVCSSSSNTTVDSDIEMDSFKSIEFDSEIAMSQSFTLGQDNDDDDDDFCDGSSNVVDKGNATPAPADKPPRRQKSDTTSLKSQKSTESIGSFINSLLSHPNTETMSKFFRGTQKAGSVPNTPKNSQKDIESFVRYPEDDNLSFGSMGSRMSSSSHLSAFSTLDITDKDDSTLRPSYAATTLAAAVDEPDVSTQNDKQFDEVIKDIFIGSIFEQSLVFFTTRLVTSKFLLAGQTNALICDLTVRVSIKNLALLVIANCVRLSPEVLLHTMDSDSLDSPPFVDMAEFDVPSDASCDELDDRSEVTTTANDAVPMSSLCGDEIQLNIIDDHFGANSRGYLDFLAPLSKSVDTVLTSRAKIDTKEELRHKTNAVNKQLTDIWSRSEIIQRRSVVDGISSVVSVLTDSGTIQKGQLMQDVLLYSTNADPILRGDVQVIVGHFIGAVLQNYLDFDVFFREHSAEKNTLLARENLLTILIMGLGDETHTVVKQALVSIELVLPALLLTQRFNGQQQPHALQSRRQQTKMLSTTAVAIRTDGGNEGVDDKSAAVGGGAAAVGGGAAAASATDKPDNATILLGSYDNYANVTIENIIDELMLVYANKYWVVQCKYCDFISKLDFESLQLIYGSDRAALYETCFVQHIYGLLGDKDNKVRLAAAGSLCQYVRRQVVAISDSTWNNTTTTVLNDFVSERIFKELPAPFSNVMATSNRNARTTTILGKVLYCLANKLLDIHDKNQQLGTVSAIVELVRHFSPVHYHAVWSEFKVLQICGSHINQNHATGTDLTSQTDLMYICTHLLAGNVTTLATPPAIIDNLLLHVLKMLNIFHHVVMGARPIFVPKGQKNDIFFTGSKEFVLFNKVGYFGNDYFYLKLYTLIKASYNSYKISINNESGSNIMTLLQTCLHSLAVMLEIKLPTEMSDSIKLIDEVLGYVSALINFAPQRSVICVQQLLKYMFRMNYTCRAEQYQQFDDLPDTVTAVDRISAVFEVTKKFCYDSSAVLATPAATASIGIHIKVFEPIVIRCLKLFTKSNAEVQSVILDMICQALEYKVNYCLLDAKNGFIEFVLKLLELIESGTVRHSDQVIPSIIKFLFCLSKQREKKLITIPKIINITDTLLANNAAIKCSTLALNELAYEFFFKQSETRTFAVSATVTDAVGPTENTALTIKDINTQKEVAFSMLIKFLDSIEVQQMISVILLLNKCGETDNENEVLVNVLQLLADQKIRIDNARSFASITQIFRVLKPAVLLDSQNFDKMLSIWFGGFVSKETLDLNRLAMVTIFLENAIGRAEEAFLFGRIKTGAANAGAAVVGSQQQGVTDEMDAAASCMAKCLFEIIVDGIVWLREQSNHIDSDGDDEYGLFREMFEKLLKTLLCLKRFPQTMAAFKREYVNARLCDTVFALKCQSVRIVLIFTEFLLNIECDKVYVLGQINAMRTNDNASVTVVDAMLKTEVLRMVCCKYPQAEQWQSEELHVLMENRMDILLVAGRQLLYDMAASQMYSIKLLSVLKVSLLVENCSKKETLDFYLDILDGCHATATAVAIETLVEKFVCVPLCCGWAKRRSATICSRKLRSVAAAAAADDIAAAITTTTTAAADRIAAATTTTTTITASDITSIYGRLPDAQYKRIAVYCEQHKSNQIYAELIEAVNGLTHLYNGNEKSAKPVLSPITGTELSSALDWKAANENWFVNETTNIVLHGSIPNAKIVQLLHEIKSESTLRTIFKSNHFDTSLLKNCIEFSFGIMTNSFRIDCAQFNPHLNYLKMQPLLRVTLITLQQTIQSLLSQFEHDPNENVANLIATNSEFGKHFKNTMVAVIVLLERVEHLELACLAHIEAHLVEKYVKEHLLKTDHNELFINFASACMQVADYLMSHDANHNGSVHTTDLVVCFKCADAILKQNYLWIALNSVEKYHSNVVLVMNSVHTATRTLVADDFFINTYGNVMGKSNAFNNAADEWHWQAVFVAKFIEINDDHVNADGTLSSRHARLQTLLISLAISVLRTNVLYFYAITPLEILANHHIDRTDDKLNRMPSIPIEYLNDVDIVDKFVKRINIFGFTSRQHFEEFFMSLLVLVNNESDLNMIDDTEQFQIKNICLSAIVELLLSCKSLSPIGNRNSRFLHFPRSASIKANTISVKKLHKVLLLLPGTNIFSLPNLERTLAGARSNNIISTNTFLANQMEMNFTWQIVEETSEKQTTVCLKNSRYFIAQSGIDLKSSVQLIFDVFAQLIESNYTLVLPHLAKLCEICENREQFRWIKDTTLKLRDVVQMENSICHQSYLKSTHLFVRNATLRGLLCLLESCVKTNTTIGGLSEELSLIRNIVINYITKYGIVEESSLAYSDEHTKLVWTLNFYLIETTSKCIPDCNLLSNTIISANNILKRTINLDQYLCILHGLERLVATNVVIKMFREKIEKIALDLVKLENERFSIPALKLLITCMYIGSAEQLENTERSNGIVQDEPEIIMESMEKIDVLFQRIKTATPLTAIIYGDVLCQIAKDLVPPNEILTKVIKELLTLSQPHCEIIAKIVFQVFRSAIDSSYLSLLQDWLICSLPNFISFPANKAVWSLTVIFLSASINLHLIKMFPEILAKYDRLGDREVFWLTLVTKDFFNGLSPDQRIKFKNVMSSADSNFNHDVLKSVLLQL